MQVLVDNWMLILSIIIIAVVATIIFFATGKRNIFEGKDLVEKIQTKETVKETLEEVSTPVTRIESSSIIEDVESIKNELQTMDVQKEIVGYALTRLYEAETEGKITEKDRMQLLEKYKDEMQNLEKAIEKKQMIVKLHDLEETKSSLVEMLHSKLDEINRNIESIKVSLGISLVKPAQVKPQLPQQAESPPAKVKKEEKPAPKAKSKAEERIEAIQEEVLKVLERLEQIETEE